MIPVGLAAVGLVLAQCGWSPAGGREPGAWVFTTDPMRDSVELELVVPEVVPAGTPVPLLLRITNPGERHLDLYLRGRSLTFDVEVTGAAGATVWRRLEGEMIPAIIHFRTLAPGETVEVATTWDQRASDGSEAGPGAYTARGLLLGEEGPLSTAPVRFRIVPR